MVGVALGMKLELKKAAKLNQEERIKYLQRSKRCGGGGRYNGTCVISLGDWQYGHGRIVRYRPDLIGPEWEKFHRDYVLTHNLHSLGATFETLKNIIDGGGQMAPTMDKLRRVPIAGMSPTADMNTGGAQYFFTRIKRKKADHTDYGADIIWKIKGCGSYGRYFLQR